jgi:hydroxymethylpyrimidine/phosphomethylpyrimidine kinase
MPTSSYRPIVVSFSGHDPCGGAGVQADIEAISSQRCHAASIITCLTVQNTNNVKQLLPQNPDDIHRQARVLLADLPVQAFKIGLIGHADIADVIAEILQQYPNIPVVLDPILAAGGGAELASEQLLNTIVSALLPLTHVVTPNSVEARRLTQQATLQQCGITLLASGCQYALITGTHENTFNVSNQLFYAGTCQHSYDYARLPADYHGSGCTLAASIAALLAHGLPTLDAIQQAQDYTWQALNAAYRTGSGQHNPNRFFWRDSK